MRWEEKGNGRIEERDDGEEKEGRWGGGQRTVEVLG